MILATCEIIYVGVLLKMIEANTATNHSHMVNSFDSKRKWPPSNFLSLPIHYPRVSLMTSQSSAIGGSLILATSENIYAGVLSKVT